MTGVGDTVGNGGQRPSSVIAVGAFLAMLLWSMCSPLITTGLDHSPRLVAADGLTTRHTDHG